MAFVKEEFTKVCGPVQEMLGIQVGALADDNRAAETNGWNEAERSELRGKIAAREPFLDFTFGRVDSNGARQQFKVSGEPMFDRFCNFKGYRGIGVEIR